MLILVVVEAFQPLLFSPPKTPSSQHGPQACWVVGRVLLKFLLIITPKARVILVIFRGNHGQCS